MKVIFLDIDGVVTSARDNGFEDFNVNVVDWLRWVCKQAPAQIVISSVWRHSFDREFWLSIFGNAVHEDWRTRDVAHFRGDEIAEWLERHPEVEQYVILDDDSDFHDHQKEHLILTDSLNGMLLDSMMALKDKFGIEGFPRRGKLYTHPNMYGVHRRPCYGL